MRKQLEAGPVGCFMACHDPQATRRLDESDKLTLSAVSYPGVASENGKNVREATSLACAATRLPERQCPFFIGQQAVGTDAYSRKVVGCHLGVRANCAVRLENKNRGQIGRVHLDRELLQPTASPFRQRTEVAQPRPTPAQARLPTGCCAPVGNPPHVPMQGTSACPQAGPVNNPAPTIIGSDGFPNGA